MPSTSSITPGDRFGRLLVKRKLPKDEFDTRSVKRTLFVCICDCGNEKIIDAGNLKKGVKSCGCWQKDNARELGRKRRTELGFLNNYWGEYRRMAKNRGREFELTREEFISIVSSPCTYCGTEPKIRKTQSTVGIAVPVNGVDRIDSDKGYTLENTTPCCSVCNKMKLDYHPEEFVLHCVKIVSKIYGTQREHADLAKKCKVEVLKHFPFLENVWKE